jgi:DNA-binding protein HU-beta
VIEEDVFNKGDEVSLPGLGTFKKKLSSERAGKNPGTGEVITIPAKRKVSFKASSALSGLQ